MSEGVGSDGGYTVMPEFANGIIDRVYSNDLWAARTTTRSPGTT
jgi:HK97 family phage major capsid protein